MAQKGESLRDRVFFIIKDNPNIVRTEVRDMLGLPNNVVTPAIKELVDMGWVVEGPRRVSMTTHKRGKTLFVSEGWQKESEAQNKVFE